MTKTTTKTSIKIAAIALLAALTFTIAATTFAASITEVQAQTGPPAKAQAILAAEPSDRGAVASGGQGGGGCGRSCTG
ncbi:MAG: hypothetical protein M3247_01360 [Thermoproteota archaeon]|nr:hypothetical protein [Thermoproteota archaeon]